MKYRPGQCVVYKNHTAEIVFCFPEYKHGKNAYTIRFFRGKTELHRLCFEEELNNQEQVDIQDILNHND